MGNRDWLLIFDYLKNFLEIYWEWMVYLNGEYEIIDSDVEMKKIMDCEHWVVVYDVRWLSERVEHLGFLNDRKLDKEYDVYLRNGRYIRRHNLIWFMKMLRAT